MARRRRMFIPRYSNIKKFGFRKSARYAYKQGGGSLIFGIGGAAAGYLAPTIHPLQDTLLTAIAVLPGVLPVGRTVPWQIRRFASGYVIGRIAKGFIGGGVSTGGSDFV